MQPTLFPRIHRLAAAAARALAGAGCAFTPQQAVTNHEMNSPKRVPVTTPVRASLAVDGQRGNPRVLMLLAVSGGGSRSAYFASQVMMKLQNVLPETDLLAEVDAISAVSGGALPAAYYALSRDVFLRRPALARRLAMVLSDGGALTKVLSTDVGAGTLKCTAPLTAGERAVLDAVLVDDTRGAAAVAALCAQSKRTDRRPWDMDELGTLMSKNYLWRMFGNMLWPGNFLPYWFTAFDRADIMAQTFADNLFDPPNVRSGFDFANNDFRFSDIDAARPYLILNATNATDQTPELARRDDEMPFGSVFTFTQEDFVSQLRSDIGSYSVARAVMASSAFPVVFPAMSLCDFRGPVQKEPPGPTACPQSRYLHVFDGGNSDNLGLKSIKRILLQKHADGELTRDYDAVVVVLIDAYATPPGVSRERYDPRDGLDFIVDTNVTDAVDSLLRSNRHNQVKEFGSGTLAWSKEDCATKSRELPPALCAKLSPSAQGGSLPLGNRMVFLHLGFDDVKGDPELLHQLNSISTSFSIDKPSRDALDRAVTKVFAQTANCLRGIGAIVQSLSRSPGLLAQTRQTCGQEDVQPPPTGRDRIAVLPALNALPTPARAAVPPVRSARSENTAP